MKKRGRKPCAYGKGTPWKKGNSLERLLDKNDGILFVGNMSFIKRGSLRDVYKRMIIRGDPVLRFEMGRPSFQAKFRASEGMRRTIYCRPWKRHEALKMYFEKYPEENQSPQRAAFASMAILDGEHKELYIRRKTNS